MDRQAEPELMDDLQQAQAYASADFSEPHEAFVDQLQSFYPHFDFNCPILDLGCGAGDIILRLLRRYPQAEVDGIDGSAPMLQLAQQALANSPWQQQVRFIQAYLPAMDWSHKSYAAVISNSLLHHLRDPLTLWQCLKPYVEQGAPVLVMDLLRPASEMQAKALVDHYAQDEPEILQHDFYHSLLAAYRQDEIEAQLRTCQLPQMMVQVVSDRHLVVYNPV